jgi:AraC-like DNA-binding protein/ligand-binding sensor protein
MDAESNKRFIARLSESQIYQDYARAFSEATGLPLALRPVESWQLAQHNKKNENPFCALMSGQNRSCAACLEVQGKLSEDTGENSKTVTCFAGLRDSAVPIRVGNELMGFLQTGQVMTRKPTRKRFLKMTRHLLDWGLNVDLNRLEEAYFHTKILDPKQYQSVVHLLAIFGQHLSLVGNQLMVQRQNAEPPTITRAKQFIQAHQADDLSLSAVAQAVNTSTFYFCKMFKKTTGLGFAQYLSRLRIEKAKNLLLNPNVRVTEVAYETGFQSLTHFNRVFKKVMGESPSAYRKRLANY